MTKLFARLYIWRYYGPAMIRHVATHGLDPIEVQQLTLETQLEIQKICKEKSLTQAHC